MLARNCHAGDRVKLNDKGELSTEGRYYRICELRVTPTDVMMRVKFRDGMVSLKALPKDVLEVRH